MFDDPALDIYFLCIKSNEPIHTLGKVYEGYYDRRPDPYIGTDTGNYTAFVRVYREMHFIEIPKGCDKKELFKIGFKHGIKVKGC